MSFNYFIHRNTQSDPHDNANEYRLYAVLDNKYYWRIEWSPDVESGDSILKGLKAGILSEKDREMYMKMRSITATELLAEFREFAYFIERAVHGFKSYLMWINPDLFQSEFPWRIPKNKR